MWFAVTSDPVHCEWLVMVEDLADVPSFTQTPNVAFSLVLMLVSFSVFT